MKVIKTERFARELEGIPAPDRHLLEGWESSVQSLTSRADLKRSTPPSRELYNELWDVPLSRARAFFTVADEESQLYAILLKVALDSEVEAGAASALKFVEDVQSIAYRLRGKVVPGRLLGWESDVRFPDFESVDPQVAARDFVADMVCNYREGCWLIEVKETKSLSPGTMRAVLEQIQAMAPRFACDRCWLVTSASIGPLERSLATSRGIFVSGAAEIRELRLMADS